MSAIVIKPAATGRLVRVEDVRTDLDLSQDAFPDAKVERLIEQASARVASFCNRTFGRQIYRERIDGAPFWAALELVLSEGPINRVLGITADGVALAANAYEFDASYLYRLRGDERVCWSGRRLVVDYEAGWLLPGEVTGTDFTGNTALPADAEKAVMQLIGMAASEGKRDIAIKQEQVEGVGTMSYYVQGSTSALPHPGAESALEQYRKLVLV